MHNRCFKNDVLYGFIGQFRVLKTKNLIQRCSVKSIKVFVLLPQRNQTRMTCDENGLQELPLFTHRPEVLRNSVRLFYALLKQLWLHCRYADKSEPALARGLRETDSWKWEIRSRIRKKTLCGTTASEHLLNPQGAGSGCVWCALCWILCGLIAGLLRGPFLLMHDWKVGIKRSVEAERWDGCVLFFWGKAFSAQTLNWHLEHFLFAVGSGRLEQPLVSAVRTGGSELMIHAACLTSHKLVCSLILRCSVVEISMTLRNVYPAVSVPLSPSWGQILHHVCAVYKTTQHLHLHLHLHSFCAADITGYKPEAIILSTCYHINTT